MVSASETGLRAEDAGSMYTGGKHVRLKVCP